MVKRLLQYCLIAVIALQAVGSVADAHESHQSGTEHVSFEHEHDEHGHAVFPDQESPDQDIDHTQPQELDCHHCCHCHGVHHHWLITNLSFSQPSIYKQTYSFQHYTLSPSPLDSILRPPIV